MKTLKTITLTTVAALALGACAANRSTTTTVPQQTTTTSSTSQSQSSSAGLISQDQAKVLALQTAGATEAAVTNLTVRQDTENLQPVYEIDFDFNGKEYSYTVKANDGSIMEREVERADVSVATQVSTDQAKATALADAGLTEQAVTNLTVQQDTEQLQLVFDVDFDHNGQEYSYTIDATTGQIIGKEQEAIN